MTNGRNCIKCDKFKSWKNFAWRNKKQAKHLSICKECHKKYVKEHYRKNKKAYIERGKKSTERYRRENRKKICEYLSNRSCVDCGENNILVLDFDHINDNKNDCVSRLLDRCSWRTVKKEIEKCEVVCANCHRIRTHKRSGTFKWKYMAK